MQQITQKLWQIKLGTVNCFVIDGGKEGLTLVDTGYPGSADKILAAIQTAALPHDVRRIILTHSHPDHAGSVAELVARTNAEVWMHAEDAALAERGIGGRLPHVLSPGLANWIIYQLLIRRSANAVPAFKADRLLEDGEEIDLHGGITVVYTPGHSLGHICLLLRSESLLIAGDLCANAMGPGLSVVYEDRKQGVASIRKAAALPFRNAVFGHGKPLTDRASEILTARFGK
jgi:glyoxylase-like metal-dependent hydrolase (beta-lactamase superfamily II)